MRGGEGGGRKERGNADDLADDLIYIATPESKELRVEDQNDVL